MLIFFRLSLAGLLTLCAEKTFKLIHKKKIFAEISTPKFFIIYSTFFNNVKNFPTKIVLSVPSVRLQKKTARCFSPSLKTNSKALTMTATSYWA